jgi:hypothetical protein
MRHALAFLPRSRRKVRLSRAPSGASSNWIAPLLSILLPMAVKPELWESGIVGGASVALGLLAPALVRRHAGSLSVPGADLGD